MNDKIYMHNIKPKLRFQTTFIKINGFVINGIIIFCLKTRVSCISSILKCKNTVVSIYVKTIFHQLMILLRSYHNIIISNN